MGHFAIIIISIVLLETLVWLKFAPPALLNVAIPPWILHPWLSMLVLQALWCTFFFLLRQRMPAKVLAVLPVGFTLVTYFLTFSPLLFLTRGWAF